ncbi:conserved hypothetical protein [Ricinus communis]|uniref:Uncharacterized protein n=1 Tax=Ricinus communis TaxID=3988 RepID=B9SYQ7_RICCO|nr:conserved hypothetical protein [Ricinus communis]
MATSRLHGSRKDKDIVEKEKTVRLDLVRQEEVTIPSLRSLTLDEKKERLNMHMRVRIKRYHQRGKRTCLCLEKCWKKIWIKEFIRGRSRKGQFYTEKEKAVEITE